MNIFSHGKSTLFLSLLILCIHGLSAREFTFGYGLVYSVNELNASEIDNGFYDIKAGGHSSFFFIETPLVKNLLLQMSPGAMNFEDGKTQFHVQYNLFSLNYRFGHTLFPFIGAGAGGCIATLTKGSRSYGEVDNGLFVRNTPALWMGRIGIGYLFKDKVVFTIEGRGIGFFDKEFKNLNSYNIGATIGMRI